MNTATVLACGPEFSLSVGRMSEAREVVEHLFGERWSVTDVSLRRPHARGFEDLVVGFWLLVFPVSSIWFLVSRNDGGR
jgi:hypothetical protein